MPPAETQPTRSWSLALATVLTLGGLLVCALLTAIHFQGGSLGCAGSGCAQVLGSRYARVLGIPLSVVGSLGLSLLLVLLAMSALTTRARLRRFGVRALRTLSGLMAVASLSLVAVQAIKLHAFCHDCLGFELIILALTYSVWRWCAAPGLGLHQEPIPGEAALMGAVARPVSVAVAPVVWTLVVVALVAALGHAAVSSVQAHAVLARSGSSQVLRIDFDPAAAGTRALCERMRQDLERSLLSHRIDHALLEQEAQQRHLDLPGYLSLLQGQVAPPTPGEIDAALAALHASTASATAATTTTAAASSIPSPPLPAASSDSTAILSPSEPVLDAERSRVGASLLQTRQQEALLRELARLRAQSSTAILLPEHPRVVSTAQWDAAYQLGPRDATIQLLVVVDAGCGLCALQLRELSQLLANPGPLVNGPVVSGTPGSALLVQGEPIHLGILVRAHDDDPQAVLLARALQAAQAQDHLWPMLSRVMQREDPSSWDQEALTALTLTLGMDRSRFLDDLSSLRVAAEVAHHSQLAQELLGTTPAPLLFLDDQLLGGYAPASALCGLCAVEAAIWRNRAIIP
jgi:uncharacterized membrane protein